MTWHKDIGVQRRMQCDSEDVGRSADAVWHKDVVCSEGHSVVSRMLGGALMPDGTRNVEVQ